MTGTTIVFTIGSDTFETGYTTDSVADVVEALGKSQFVRCDSSIGEVYVNPYNIQYVKAGREGPRRNTAAASGNADHQRLVGGQSL